MLRPGAATVREASGRRGHAGRERDRPRRRHDRQGQLPPLHAEGDLRAAERHRRHARRLLQPGCADGGAARPPLRTGDWSRAGDHRRLRHLLLRRPRRPLLDRADRASAGGDRHRVRVPLPRAAAGRGERRALHLAIRRDRGHAGSAPLRTRGRHAERRGGERAREHHGAGGGRGAAHLRRASRSGWRPRRRSRRNS